AMACGVAVISSDCKSGPREILAPMSDFEFQTKESELGEFGVLNPMFSGDFENRDIQTKKIWIDSIIKLLNDDNLREEYSKKAKIRANDFSKDSIVKEWVKIIK
ncbi:MAG: glycosyltransferase, partial [Campylobacterales bacterium]|nr:glycosyltransferase [Campylobacterales bacterium]